MEPYKFKKIFFQDGLLKKSVDATYIIHLESNHRYDHIINQLKIYHPTNIVYILFNKGYKKSNKKKFINSPGLDLIDAFLEIFKHAENKKYNNILILEDDFIFSDKIKKKEHINNINNTINNLGDIDFMYLLGCIPYTQIPYNLCNYRILSTGTHAVIYSKHNRNRTLKTNQQDIKDWDIYNNKNINRFTYYIPLCYQLFPITDNSKVWCKDMNIFIYITSQIIKKVFKFVDLDTQVEPGTTIFYFLSKSITLIISSIFLLIISNRLIKNDIIYIILFIFIIILLQPVVLKQRLF
jgi:hypothetical protein